MGGPADPKGGTNVRAEGFSRSGGRILVDQLQLQGVERLTCVPGESFLAVLDALHDASIDVVVCRQEGGAAIMAEAYGKLTGRPGICFATRGPGATNASAGVHVAFQDSTPMILLIGQVGRDMIDREGKIPSYIVKALGDIGAFGIKIPTEYGGLGLSAWTYAQIVIKVAGAWMAPSGIFNSHLIVASAIERNGTEKQKQKYLPRMAAGELRGSIGLTEPNAGSDLQAILTTAKLDGDDYVVNGSKMWITNSMYGHFTLLLVKTDPDAQPRHKGMSLLIAEKGPGYNVNKLKKMGYRSIDTCEINFDNYRVSKDNLLGGVEGHGSWVGAVRAGDCRDIEAASPDL